MSHSDSKPFSVAEARAIVYDLFQPSLKIYWTDFLISLTIGYAAVGVYFTASLFSAQQIIAFFVAGFAFHRVANFMHEIAHLKSKNALRSFRVGWDLLAGIPMMIPSYFFENHMAHHNSKHFATGTDCEYVPLGRGPVREIFQFLSQVLLQPLFVITRFVILSPISLVCPPLRRWTLERASAFVFVFQCRRDAPTGRARAWFTTIETLCWARASAIFLFVYMGWNPMYRIPQLYLLAIFTLGLHYFRSLGAHHYLGDGDKMSFYDQLMDSIDIKGVPVLTELLFPVGLRYHALHHLFPAMPYHNLPAAHRRLMAELPADSPYRDLVYPNFLAVLKQLFANARRKNASTVAPPARKAA